MMIGCKTCGKEFVPTRKNIKNCSKCLSKKNKQNTIEEEDDEMDNETQSTETTPDEIEELPQELPHTINGELMIGSVVVESSNTNTNPTIKQQITLVNDKLNNTLKHVKLFTDATDLDSSETISDMLKVVMEKVDKINNNLTCKTDSEDVMNLLKSLNKKVDDNSSKLNELKNTLI